MTDHIFEENVLHTVLQSRAYHYNGSNFCIFVVWTNLSHLATPIIQFVQILEPPPPPRDNDDICRTLSKHLWRVAVKIVYRRETTSIHDLQGEHIKCSWMIGWYWSKQIYLFVLLFRMRRMKINIGVARAKSSSILNTITSVKLNKNCYSLRSHCKPPIFTWAKWNK